MSHRVNIILDDHAWQALNEFPRGERSKLVSKAITSLVAAQRKIKAAQKMDAIRKSMPEVSTRDIVSWVRADRKR